MSRHASLGVSTRAEFGVAALWFLKRNVIKTKAFATCQVVTGHSWPVPQPWTFQIRGIAIITKFVTASV